MRGSVFYLHLVRADGAKLELFVTAVAIYWLQSCLKTCEVERDPGILYYPVAENL